MIMVAIIFGGIFCFECRYLLQKKRKLRTFFLVLSSVLIIFAGLETISYFKDRCTITQVIEKIFEPVEKVVRMGN